LSSRPTMSGPITVEKFAIGQSVRRVEDPRLIKGFGRYSDDVNLPRQAYAVVVRSPHAHATIRSIDTSAARKASGVLGVLTGEDLAADKIGDLPTDKRRKRRDGTPAYTTPGPAPPRAKDRHPPARQEPKAARRNTRIHDAAPGAGARPRAPRRRPGGPGGRRDGRAGSRRGRAGGGGIRALAVRC